MKRAVDCGQKVGHFKTTALSSLLLLWGRVRADPRPPPVAVVDVLVCSRNTLLKVEFINVVS